MVENTATEAFDAVPLLARQLELPRRAVATVVELLAAGGTVPFIARYRKEATGALDEVQIRTIEERHAYLVELERRRQKIIASIDSQGKLTAELRRELFACGSKSELEDIYLPFRPKRRTRASIARERGLEGLAALIDAQPTAGDPLAEARAYVDADKGVVDAAAALAGARDIVAEQIAEDPQTRRRLRRLYAERAELTAEARRKKSAERTKFEQYYGHSELARSAPSHRYLAVVRGEREKVLRVRLVVDEAAALQLMAPWLRLDRRSPWAGEKELAAADAFRRLLAPSLEKELRAELKERADRAAVEVFARNLRQLLLAGALGGRPVVALDPGLRTGCKCVALDGTGRYLDATTVYVHEPKRAQEAGEKLRAFVVRHAPAAVAVGNGTGGRRAFALAREVSLGIEGEPPMAVQVNEAGASVYSASDVAREELPELDVTLRGAVSIGRRLQDPLAELVKIEPKAIGVGQYQHDVDQGLLQRKLDEVVESCVNAVGVELNTASAPLLARVAGIGPALASKIVGHRQAKGSFRTRAALLEVKGLGARTFEQAAGFLRVRGSPHPLDASGVHPERYGVVERMSADCGCDLADLVGDAARVAAIEIARYLDPAAGLGEPTLADIVAELKKPGRDPRPRFEPPRFRDDVTEIADLQPGMTIDGVVTNVTNFGAFVDVGVHQDGLVHISKLADRFVRDPHEVVSVGDRLQVRVLDVDLERQRISLSARREDDSAVRGGAAAQRSSRPGERGQRRGRSRPGRQPASRPGKLTHSPFAALDQLGKKKE